MGALENIVHFINQNTNELSIERLTELFDISIITYYRNRNRYFAVLTSIEKSIHLWVKFLLINCLSDQIPNYS
ncbi:MAG: hypothetical protein IC227_04830 [Enterococcus lacertideformus]|uniref:Uncharacterized protein n=1 Tax=Enterococcus lacertideformus TaxID=2771493 RepID=A0A931AZS4_9ENTE|nr:hypothetical protein [Enterococcus lacertideformus]